MITPWSQQSLTSSVFYMLQSLHFLSSIANVTGFPSHCENMSAVISFIVTHRRLNLKESTFPRVQGRLLLPLATDPCHATHSWVLPVLDLKTWSKHLCWEHITIHLIQVGKILLHLSFLALASGPLLYHTTKIFFSSILSLSTILVLPPSLRENTPMCIRSLGALSTVPAFSTSVHWDLISSPAVAVYLLTIVQILQVTTLLVKYQPQGKEMRNS